MQNILIQLLIKDYMDLFILFFIFYHSHEDLSSQSKITIILMDLEFITFIHIKA